MINYLLKPFEDHLPENNRLERIWKLAQVDFKKRYYNDYLGLLWALLNPVFRMAIYYFVFVKIFQRSMPNYHLYLFLGLIFWLFFSESTKKGMTTLLTKRYLIENIVFNRLDLFYSLTLSVVFGLFFNMAAYLTMSLLTGVFFTWHILLFPIFLFLVYMLSVSCSMILATLNIYFKDIAHIWDMVILLGFWVTPIFYSAEALEAQASELMYINPLAGIIVNARNVTLFGTAPDWGMVLYNFAYCMILFIISRAIFLKYSHKAAEKL